MLRNFYCFLLSDLDIGLDLDPYIDLYQDPDPDPDLDQYLYTHPGSDQSLDQYPDPDLDLYLGLAVYMN